MRQQFAVQVIDQGNAGRINRIQRCGRTTFAKVIATIDNHEGMLKTGMTGEAKIDGETMPVWEAFSQAVIRFVKVQLWSWIP